MKKLVFAGCSYTAGNGWLDIDPKESMKTPCKDSPYLWTNLCYNNIKKFQNLEQINLGHGGASNTEILENTAKIIGEQGSDIGCLFVQWTMMPRYNFNVGFELWPTSENFESNRNHDINLNRGESWSREYLNDLLNRLKVLHHMHWEILKVVKYTNIILNLSKKLKFDVFFINGLCPWDLNYFSKLENVQPNDYTEFTKIHILNISTRDDEDIYKLYDLAHAQYQEVGGIDDTHWINLYNSFQKERSDVNFDLLHPGLNSNQRYFDIIKSRLNELNFI